MTEDQPKQADAAPAPAPQPVAPPVVQPQTQPVVAVASQGPGFFMQYFTKVKSIFMNPKSVQDAAPSSIKDSLIFTAMNLGVMSVVMLITSMITYAVSSSPDFSGEYFGELFKGIFLSILFACIFLSAITGIIYIITLIAKKVTKFSDLFSVISLFSLNFLAVATAAIIGVLLVWLTDVEVLSFVAMLKSLVTSLVFVYTMILIINGIVKTTNFNLFISCLIYVIPSIIFVFIMGKIISTFPIYFSLSFGNYGGVSDSVSSALNALKNLMESYGF